MSHFLTRVELLNYATETHYENLHQAMSKVGFSRIITDSNGVSYHLPPAQYYKQSNDKLGDVQSLAKRTADSIKTPNRVITTEGTSTWNGLDVASNR